jgi:hypothetical protein
MGTERNRWIPSAFVFVCKEGLAVRKAPPPASVYGVEIRSGRAGEVTVGNGDHTLAADTKGGGDDSGIYARNLPPPRIARRVRG